MNSYLFDLLLYMSLSATYMDMTIAFDWDAKHKSSNQMQIYIERFLPMCVKPFIRQTCP